MPGEGTGRSESTASSAAPTAVGEAESEMLLSFREHMWDSFGKLWTEDVEPSRKLLEDFSASIKDRIQVERAYAVGLARLTERLQPHLDKGSVPAPIEALIVNVRNRADQSEWIADEMEQDVLSTLETMLSQHLEVSKRVHADGSKLMKQWQEAQKAYDSVASKYAQACHDAEESAKECINGVSLRPAERTKLASRSLMLCRQATAAEREYYKGVHKLNAAVEVQQRQMGHVLQAVQTMQEKRGQCCKDSAMKIVVYETSWLRNVQYDLNNVISTAENHDPQAELQKYILENRSPKPLPVKSNPKGFWDLAAVNGSAARGRTAAVASQQGEAVFSERLNVVRPLLRELLTPATDGSGGTPSPPGESRPAEHELTELHRGLAEDGSQQGQGGAVAATGPAVPAPLWSAGATYRAALCTALREALLGPGSAASATTSQSAKAPAVRLGSSVFSAVVALFMKALDGCMQENDVWNGRDLMVLAPKVMSEVEGGKLENILTKVFPHAMWGQKAFWEEMLLVSIAEAHAQVAISRRTDAPGTEHPEVAMSYFLQTYVYYMHLFGIKKDQATASVAKTLQKHTHLLGNTVDNYMELLARGPAPSQAAPTAPS
mmetsp:Transcript_21394/g.49792  ORF Transcript_21394/g.49792 Transcript_21394/m.49792 type:complete len:606 (-) Transcript_21394:103-1920(-)